MKHSPLRGASIVLVASSLVFAARAQTADKAMTAFKAGQWKEVFAAVTAVPGDSADRPKALYIAGEAYLVVGQPVEAADCFRRVLEQRPNAVPAKIGLGRALTAQEKLDEAEKVLGELAKTEAKDPLVKQALGELHVHAKKLVEARAEWPRRWRSIRRAP